MKMIHTYELSHRGTFSTNRKLGFEVFVVVIVHNVVVKVDSSVSEEHASIFLTEFRKGEQMAQLHRQTAKKPVNKTHRRE